MGKVHRTELIDPVCYYYYRHPREYGMHLRWCFFAENAPRHTTVFAAIFRSTLHICPCAPDLNDINSAWLWKQNHQGQVVELLHWVLCVVLEQLGQLYSRTFGGPGGVVTLQGGHMVKKGIEWTWWKCWRTYQNEYVYNKAPFTLRWRNLN